MDRPADAWAPPAAGLEAPAEDLAGDPSSAELGEIQSKATSGFLKTVGAKGFRTAVSLVVGVLLARILGPEAYGVSGVALALVGVITVVNNVGLNTATVQRQELSDADVSSAFWFQSIVSTLVALGALGVAWAAARFYDDVQIGYAIAALSPMFLIVGLSEQPEALLRRRMAFGKIAACEITAVVVSASLAVVLATLGVGFWALIAQQLSQFSVLSAGYWIASGWRPGPPRIGRVIFSYLSFSLPLFFLQLLEMTAAQADRAVLGKHFDRAQVGLYERSTTIVAGPIRQLAQPLSVVMLPALSALQRQPSAFSAMFLRGLRMLSWLVFPLTGVIAGAASDVVPLLLGAKWTAAVGIFRYASLGVAWLPLVACRQWVFLSLGRTRPLLLLGGSSAALLLLVVVLTGPYGPETVALGRSLTLCFTVATGLIISAWIGKIPLGGVLRAMLGPLLTGAAGGGLGVLLYSWGWASPILRVVAVSVATGLAAWAALHRSGDDRRLLAELRRRLPARFTGGA